MANELQTIAIAAVTSGLVSTVLGTVLKYRLDRKMLLLSQSNERELVAATEQIKAQHQMAQEVGRNRRDTLPKLEAILYRVRNRARHVTSASVVSDGDIEKLTADAAQLENTLYEFRLYLETEHVFLPIHSYKNTVLLFLRTAEESSAAARDPNCPPGRTTELRHQRERIYDDLDQGHSAILEKLKELASYGLH